MMSDKMTQLARNLRKNMTDTEHLLWNHLRAKQLEGLKFRRQEPIGSYIVDFVCFEKQLIIEVDGGQHCDEKDHERDNWLKNEGFRVLRFWNNEVLTNISGVLDVIRENTFDTPLIAPPKMGGEEERRHSPKMGEELTKLY